MADRMMEHLSDRMPEYMSEYWWDRISVGGNLSGKAMMYVCHFLCSYMTFFRSFDVVLYVSCRVLMFHDVSRNSIPCKIQWEAEYIPERLKILFHPGMPWHFIHGICVFTCNVLYMHLRRTNSFPSYWKVCRGPFFIDYNDAQRILIV